MNYASILAAAVLLFTMAACSSSDEPESAPDTTPANDASTPDDDDANSSGDAVQLGEPVDAGGGNITIYGYEQPYEAEDRDDLLDPGNEFASVDAEVCAPDTGEAESFDPRLFQLVMPDNRRAEPVLMAIPVRNPEFPDQPITPGDCLRGWITYQVPENQQPVAVSLATTPIRWEIR